jgi:hypothetical protein
LALLSVSTASGAWRRPGRASSSLTGLKFKIAHKRAGSDKWSATPKTQRKRMIQFLQGVIADLEKQSEDERDVSERISDRPEIGTARPIEPVAARRRSAKPAPASSERPASRRPPVQRRPAASHAAHRTSRGVAAGA